MYYAQGWSDHRLSLHPQENSFHKCKWCGTPKNRKQDSKREEKGKRVWKRDYGQLQTLDLEHRTWVVRKALSGPAESPALFFLSQHNLPIEEQAVGRGCRGRSDALSMLEIITTVSMATIKCPPWLLLVFWARRYDVKACAQKAVGRDGSRELCDTLPMIPINLGHVALSGMLGFLQPCFSGKLQLCFWTFPGTWAKQESKSICSSRSFINKCLEVGTWRTEQCVLLSGGARVSSACFTMEFPHPAPLQGAQSWPFRDLPGRSSECGWHVDPHFHRILILHSQKYTRQKDAM